MKQISWMNDPYTEMLMEDQKFGSNIKQILKSLKAKHKLTFLPLNWKLDEEGNFSFHTFMKDNIQLDLYEMIGQEEFIDKKEVELTQEERKIRGLWEGILEVDSLSYGYTTFQVLVKSRRLETFSVVNNVYYTSKENDVINKLKAKIKTEEFMEFIDSYNLRRSFSSDSRLYGEEEKLFQKYYKEYIQSLLKPAENELNKRLNDFTEELIYEIELAYKQHKEERS